MSVMVSKDSHALMEFTEDKISLLKNTIAKGCTDSELELFVHACKRLGLDPFMKQIYAVKRGNTMTIQTGIDGYRLIAERSGKYIPGKEPTFTYDKNGQLFSATSYVKKMDAKGEWHEIAATAIYSEYAGIGQLWSKMGHTMLAKCAESAALRKAFPAEMAGVYTEEEMEQADKCNRSTGEVKKELISVKEALELETLIGHNEAFKKNVFSYYSKEYGVPVNDFSDLRQCDYEMVHRKATVRAKLDDSSEAIEVENA